ncbi:TPA: MFS transporter [Campylobacter jejuni]|nr:MFS transporter [Campylobacter jejuni]
MFDFFKPKAKAIKFPKDEILPRYYKIRTWSLSGVFIGYMGYYLVRNNITLATPFIQNQLELSKSDIGTITGSMLIAYGISKGAMSVLSDKADPKKYMALGLILCALINVLLDFSNSFYAYVGFVIALGVFQGMGVGPSFITLANWYPKKERGIYTAVWNISHNIGGGIVAPIVSLSGFALAALLGVSMANFNETYWHMNHFYTPAACAVIISLYALYAVKGNPKNEGLVDITEINEMRGIKTEEIKAIETPNLSSFEIFYHYVLKNKNAWYVAWMDTFVYMVRFGLISWLPIYLLETKGFNKEQIGIAFWLFEWAAIPSTLLAGYISDKIFKGYRMPPAIGAMVIIFFMIIGYFTSNNLYMVIFFAAMAGCLVYIPQFLASMQTMEVVPAFAVGSCVGLHGFMSYVVGASLGTKA